MSKRGERRVWARAKAVARSLAPAETWRERLASTLLELPDVVASWVFSCPPGFPFAARGVVLPEAAGHGAARMFLQRFLPAIERKGEGSRMAQRFGGQPYAALDLAEDDALVARVRGSILAPLGAVDLIHAFLVIEGDVVVGWLSLCTGTTAAAMLERAGSELAEVSGLASRSLANALLVAEGCGARVPRFASPPDRALSDREAQIAQLVVRGLSDLNIAHRLRISEHTVATHLRSVFGKLGVHSRVELAAHASALATVDPRGPRDGEPF